MAASLALSTGDAWAQDPPPVTPPTPPASASSAALPDAAPAPAPASTSETPRSAQASASLRAQGVSPGATPVEPVGRTPYGWNPAWRRFNAWDYAGTAATLAGFYLVETMPSPTTSHWNQPVPLIDRPFRNFIAGRTHGARDTAEELSDIFWYASVAYPVAASLVVPAARGGGVDMSWQLTMMNLEAFAVVSLLTRLPHKLIGRRRPNSIGCDEDSEYSEQCGRPGQLVSFWGGHTAVSMTGAGLACAHHLNGHLYGDPTADALACGAAVAAGQAVSVFRMQADKHWLSDNLIGSAVGALVGFGMPTFLHYRPFWRPKRVELAPPSAATPPPVRLSFMPMISPSGGGGALSGIF
ncbi:MAG: phosphatase PAP2 family protein [Polyangiaceae bacterium]|jgi:hypothetical protein|nr:phosphatase PAP2 family protein [Polyangiaceae bacterium]